MSCPRCGATDGVTHVHAAELRGLAPQFAGRSDARGRNHDSILDALREALDDWQSDYDEGWGDRFASGLDWEGGFALMDHGSHHTAKEFHLLRAARAWLEGTK